jgi:hypothetical protein
MNRRLMIPLALGMAALGGSASVAIHGGSSSLSKYSPLRPDALPCNKTQENARRVRQMERIAAKAGQKS